MCVRPALCAIGKEYSTLSRRTLYGGLSFGTTLLGVVFEFNKATLVLLTLRIQRARFAAVPVTDALRLALFLAFRFVGGGDSRSQNLAI